MDSKPRKILWSSAALFSLPLLCFFAIRSGSPTFADERNNVMLAVQQLFSNEAETRNAAVNHMLDQRKDLIDQLIPIVAVENARKYDATARATAAYLLGQMRAAEAAPVLAKALAQDPSPDFNFDIDRYRLPYFNAVGEIGGPAGLRKRRTSSIS